MLRFLGVRHLAVIEHLEVEFEPGLNIITGETGAGKSVLLEAISLLAGGRASSELVRTGQQQAVVQAIFQTTGEPPRDLLIRRDISAQGRSRGFVDDVLVTSGAMREVGATLVDLHGQHEHHVLLDPTSHLDVVDTYGGDLALAGRVAAAFDAWRAATGKLDRSQMDDREKQARIEIASFHLQEIERAAPVADEDVQLEGERAVLANADRLTRWSSEAYAALYEGESAALSALSAVWKRLADLAAVDARFVPYLDQREAMKTGLEDLAFFLRSYAADLDGSPERLQAVEDRLAVLDRLKKKYGPALTDVLARQETLRAELAELGSTADQRAQLEADERRLREQFVREATAASVLRKAAAERLARALERELDDLAMPKCQIDVRVSASDDSGDWTSRGIDAVEIHLSPNPGEELRPLAKIASGGELSRIMLALHTLAATGEPGRTLVFDEVDAGIGGAAADAVGARLQALARRFQVLCVTHLPQVAARAGAHFHVAKIVQGGRTATTLTRLDDAGREREIARMIAGTDVSQQVLTSARELLASRGESEVITKGESPSGAKAKGRRRGA